MISNFLRRALFQTASSSGDPHVHIIRDVKSTDSGLYTCIAGNVLGQATASAYLVRKTRLPQTLRLRTLSILDNELEQLRSKIRPLKHHSLQPFSPPLSSTGGQLCPSGSDRFFVAVDDAAVGGGGGCRSGAKPSGGAGDLTASIIV